MGADEVRLARPQLGLDVQPEPEEPTRKHVELVRHGDDLAGVTEVAGQDEDVAAAPLLRDPPQSQPQSLLVCWQVDDGAGRQIHARLQKVVDR